MDIGSVTVVESMHERKEMMAAKSDAFVALPGGFGTLDELVEIITWVSAVFTMADRAGLTDNLFGAGQSQIGIHAKPIVLFNADGFFDNFLKMMEDFYASGFVDEETRGILSVAATANEVIVAIETYVAPEGRLTLSWKESVEN